MILFHRMHTFLRWVFCRRKAEQELSYELRDFVERAAVDKVDDGMSQEEAERSARIELGGLEQVKEGVRATRVPAWFDGLGLDIRLGFRMLRKSWGLTLVGGLAMALTIGLTVTFFATEALRQD